MTEKPRSTRKIIHVWDGATWVKVDNPSQIPDLLKPGLYQIMIVEVRDANLPVMTV